MFLIDASAWVTLVEGGSPHRDAVASLVRERGQVLGALDLTLYEVGNAIGVKQGRATEAGKVLRLIDRCCRDRIHAVGPELLEAALDLAGEHDLTAYDAAYVAASRRFGLTLVSTDIADLVSRGLAVTPDAAV